MGTGRAVGEFGDTVSKEQNFVRTFETRGGILSLDAPTVGSSERDQRRMVILQTSGPHAFIWRLSGTLHTQRHRTTYNSEPLFHLIPPCFENTT